MSTADAEMTGVSFMTQIILKMAELKEGTQGIAGKGASGVVAVFGSAIGRAFARKMPRSGFNARFRLIPLRVESNLRSNLLFARQLFIHV